MHVSITEFKINLFITSGAKFAKFQMNIKQHTQAILCKSGSPSDEFIRSVVFIHSIEWTILA